MVITNDLLDTNALYHVILSAEFESTTLCLQPLLLDAL